ncbi:MAG: putative Co/Zn/Cd efflux system rane fusion protein [Devosia sp.]|uniref:efflux RND transporter periplasmic adaptor subunit n=1 Tax=Devosia sp. TaxID=1871048 RepID=UPI002605D038|nr:efflux RND transporter periplasmic adaptor subunit [Devosia sp.]MDB5541495.1 putative Co/Zn/Cd efflux system rane fusion protein [Devosia sp.]
MFRQLLLSLVVIGAAAAAYVFLVPGAHDTLARFGIELPFAPQAEAATGPAGQAGAQAQQGGGQAGGGQGGGGQRGGPGGRGGNRTMVVVTAPVLSATINDKLTAIGEGAAAHSVTVVSPANGTLAELLVKPGDAVAAGAVIGQLDAEAEQIALQGAQLAFDDAETALTRTNALAKANNATSVQVAAAQLAFNKARLDQQNAALALQKRTISTPIAGVVGLFQVSPGNTVTAQTVVTTIEDTSHILVSFWVPERYASAITPGMPVTAAAVALPGETIAGAVSAVDNRIDSASRTLKVEAEIPNEAGRLRPGMSFSVSMAFPGEQFPSVDPLAIQWSSQGSYLWKFVDGKVDRVPVEIIQRNSDGVLVKAELAEGDQVVTQGVQQLTAGASVRLLDDPAGGAGGGGGGGQRPARGNPS